MSVEVLLCFKHFTKLFECDFDFLFIPLNLQNGVVTNYFPNMPFLLLVVSVSIWEIIVKHGKGTLPSFNAKPAAVSVGKPHRIEAWGQKPFFCGPQKHLCF